MGRHHHLSLEEREDIMRLVRQGKSIGQVARALGRSCLTVSRELVRNSCARLYRASTAQRRYESRREACRRLRLLDDEGWRAIARRNPDTPELARTARSLAGRLRHKGKRRHRTGGPEERRGKIPGATPIFERPAEAGSRSRPGDWEDDTVVGRGAGARLVTLADRRSGFLAGGRAASRTKADATSAQVAALAGQPCEAITVDRGREFAGHAEVAATLGAHVYFALPHHPWQRGANENANGLVREYFPKGTDFARVGDDEVAAAYDALNCRPCKRLGFRTPLEVRCSEVLHLL